MSELLCVECGKPCEMIEEAFDYSGTHCTNGASGTHKTGVYKTKCCDSDSIEGYSGWHIEYNAKPIPYRGADYDFWHDDYDGADGGNGLCGTAGSVQDAVDQIGEFTY